MQFGRLVIRVLPLEIHQQTQALRIEFVTLTRHDFFEEKRKAFLLLLSCFLIFLGSSSQLCAQ